MQVFISHSFADEDLAFELKDILMERGIKGYLAQKDDSFGGQLHKKITNAISESEYLIAIITQKGKESATVQQEIGYASGKHIPIIIMSEEKPNEIIIIGNLEQKLFTRENFKEECIRIRTFLLGEPEIITSKIIQNEKTLRLVKGDITRSNVDVIVNPANSKLRHLGGLAKHIVRNGGHSIQKESDKIGFIPVGNAVMTNSGKLPCKAIIHAVGPKWGEGDEDKKLQNAVRNSLELASQKNFNNIAMPAISAGLFGFPKDRCAKILISESIKYFEKNPNSSLDRIEFCVYEEETEFFFKNQFKLL